MTKAFDTSHLRTIFGVKNECFVLEPAMQYLFFAWEKHLDSGSYPPGSSVTDFKNLSDSRSCKFLAIVDGRIVEVSAVTSYFLHCFGYKDQSMIYRFIFTGEAVCVDKLMDNLRNFITKLGLDKIKNGAEQLLLRDCACRQHMEVYEFYSPYPETPRLE